MAAAIDRAMPMCHASAPSAERTARLAHMPASSLPVGRTGSPADRTRESLATVLLGTCFLLSGFAALVYQTAWTRQFALVFGTSELAVATVLAAYMGGLAAGAWIVERWLPRVVRPVLVYAGLELGIGLSAVVLVPMLIHACNAVLVALFGNQPAPPDSADTALSIFYLVSAFVALALPTTLMGATLPLLARHAVRDESQIGSRIGTLYAMNTAGAVAGALVTAFWVLPTVGLAWTVRVAAAVNVLVFALAALLARSTDVVPALARDRHPAPARVRGVPAPEWILPLILLSGAVSFFHEVLWTRMLTHVLGSSIQAFGVMVATFLAGIALGGGAGAFLARTRERSVPAFALSQLASAVAAGAAFVMLGRHVPPAQHTLIAALYDAGVLIPLTFFIGMTFPLAVRILARDVADAPLASARVYAWNTVGAIAGALAAGFVLIPWLRFEGSVRVAVAASCALAAVAAWVLVPPSRTFAVAVTVFAVAISALFRPGVPDALLRASPLNIRNDGRMVHYSVGRSASVVMLEQDGTLMLRTNGLPEALIETSGSPPRVSGESWLTPLAVMARPQTRDMLIVGYGGGSVVEGVPPSVRNIDVIELEPQVLAANRATQALRKGDPLADQRLHVVVNDARGALSLTSRKYDAIVSQPSHPWTAGASHLYTFEFMRLAREHLNEGGVFVQWMNVTFLDELLLRSLTATLSAAFGEVRIYRPDPNTLVFLASATALPVERAMARTGAPLSAARAHYAKLGINTLEDVVAALAVDSDGARALGAGAPLVTDDQNRMATSSVYRLNGGMTPEDIGRLLADYDPLQRADSAVYRDLRHRLSFGYIARRQAMFAALDPSAIERITAMESVLGTTAAGAAVRIARLEAIGEQDAAADAAREAVRRYPGNQALRQLYLQRWIGALARGRAPPDITARADALGEGAEAVIRATRLESERDIDGLRQIDPVLARVPWTDPWKLEAVQLRAGWRGRVAAGPLREKLANECIALVDEAIVVQPTLILYQDRARCALAAGRADALVESLWYFGQGLYATSLRLTPEDRARTKRDLHTVINLLRTAMPAEPGSAVFARRQEVIDKLRDNIRRLEAL